MRDATSFDLDALAPPPETAEHALLRTFLEAGRAAGEHRPTSRSPRWPALRERYRDDFLGFCELL